MTSKHHYFIMDGLSFSLYKRERDTTLRGQNMYGREKDSIDNIDED